MTKYEAYVGGWQACMAGVDGRCWSPEDCEGEDELRHAWVAGWQDAFDADDGKQPLPAEWLEGVI